MAIEKMIMMDMVGYIGDLDSVCKSIVLSKLIQPVNALQEIDTTDFSFGKTEEDNLEKLIDVCYIRPFTGQRDYSDIDKQIKRLKQICKPSFRQRVKHEELIDNFDELSSKTQDIEEKFTAAYDDLTSKINKKEQIEKYLKYLKCMKDINIPIEEFTLLKNFNFQMHRITKSNMQKISQNYENVPSVIFNVYEDEEYAYVIIFTPKALIDETQRILKSLNSETIDFPTEYHGTPISAVDLVKSEIEKLNSEIAGLNEKLKQISKENGRTVQILIKSFELEMKANEIKNQVACTNEFFYLCGWVPQSETQRFTNSLGQLADRIIMVEKQPDKIKNSSIVPPTKLKNNFFVRPFEAMVNMYGMPTYGELDPTTFLGITYTIIFGAMFGDLGQGLVFFFAGLFLKYKKNRPNFGGVLARLGLSSSIFGFVYGSCFGFENIIPALVVRPMENIMSVLLCAVAFGCVLLMIGYVYSLINCFRKKDIENGLFSKNGLAGMLFYALVLIFAVTKLKNISTMPMPVWITIFITLLIIIYMKQPITNLLLKKRPLFGESKGDYLVEEGFGIAETLLSMFSNTLSFIRVGAFALNHVGLFVAFSALAKMMHSGIGSAAMYILGNVVILGLEGLIVFIQGLRLEYYELFSKYYEGAGVPFEPIGISEDYRLNIEKKAMQKMESKIVLGE